jgi:hypothetical protein
MRGISTRASVLAGSVLYLWVLCPSVRAQVDTGTIQGTVTDASSAVVPGATVTIINEATSFRQTLATREDGTYVFTPVRIGRYTVEVTATGFQKARQTGVQVNIQQQTVIDLVLSPGELTQTVEVQALAPVLQTQNGSVGETITSRTINNLPLSGRNYNFLARLTAGVTHPQPEGRGLNATGWFTANGTRPAQNNFLLDGIDNNSNNVDFLSGAAYVLRPPVDAVNEFKLQTNSFNAEFGRAGGAVLNASLKSGSNSFHGSAWEFLRNEKLDAADFFQNANNQRKGAFKQNQFGVAAGGPFVRNKMFWFADFEGTRIRQAIPTTASVPTAAQRASGFTDFSDLMRLQSGSRTDLLGRTFPLGTVFDPSTTRAVGNGWVREPFPGNVIPAGRLNPNAVKLLELYPAPTNAGLFNNYFANRNNTDDTNSFDVRVDYNISERDQVFGRYSFAEIDRFKPGPFDGFADGGGFNNGDENIRTQGAALSYMHTFSPTLVNEVRAGFNREHVVRLQPFGNDTSDIPAQFGIQGIPQVEGNGGLPGFSIGGLSNLGPSDWIVSERFSNTVQLSENLTKIYGGHTFKGGWEGQLIDFPWKAPPTSRGRFTFGGVYTSVPNQTDSSTGRAQFLLNPTSPSGEGGIGANQVAASNFGGVANRKYYSGVYFQDDWKATRRLTLNLGIRWDFFSLVGERYDAQANFVPGPPGAGARYYIPASRRDNPVLSASFMQALARDGIELVYTDDYGSGLGTSQKMNFAPRFGFAFQVTSKLVLRGGYGIYYGAFENRGGFPNLGYNYPFQFDFNFQRANDVSPVVYPDGNIATLERGLSSVPLEPRFVSGNGLNLRGIEFDYKTPYTQGYNFTIQYELFPNTAFEVGYVASLGRHLETFTGTNHVTQILPPSENPARYIPFPSFARGSSYATTDGNSHYHSLQTKFTKRFSHGLDFLLTYTWAKTLTNAGDLLNGGGVGGFRAPNIPGMGIREDMGLASFHINHAFTFNGTWELPFGRGRALLTDAGGFTQALFGGWSTNWIATLYSGQAQTIGCTVATAAGAGCFALMVPGQDLYVGRVEQFYNPAAFADPPVARTIGQSDFAPLGGSRTQVTGPPYRKLDLSLFKDFVVSERYRFQFRAESFNITNTPAFALPSITNFRDALNFGKIVATRNNPNDARQIQLALKFYW